MTMEHPGEAPVPQLVPEPPAHVGAEEDAAGATGTEDNQVVFNENHIFHVQELNLSQNCAAGDFL